MRSIRTWILVFVVSGCVVVAAWKIQNLSGQLHVQQVSAVKNRVVNVLTWCNAINNDRIKLRAYVAAAQHQDPRVLSLNLPTLPCQMIADRTAQSTK